MPIRLDRSQSQFVGAIGSAVFGLGVFLAGCHLIVCEYMLAEPVKVAGSIIDSGQIRSSRGGNTNFISHEFVDQFGETWIGRSSGCSGLKGGTILVEYSARFPAFHRLAGEGRMSQYESRWPIAGFGLFFLVAGVHWWWSIRKGGHPPNEPKY